MYEILRTHYIYEKMIYNIPIISTFASSSYLYRPEFQHICWQKYYIKITSDKRLVILCLGQYCLNNNRLIGV